MERGLYRACFLDSRPSIIIPVSKPSPSLFEVLGVSFLFSVAVDFIAAFPALMSCPIPDITAAPPARAWFIVADAIAFETGVWEEVWKVCRGWSSWLCNWVLHLLPCSDGLGLPGWCLVRGSLGVFYTLAGSGVGSDMLEYSIESI